MAQESVINPSTGNLDKIGMSASDWVEVLLGLYLKLDQTIQQNVINGAPQFDEGIYIKADKRLYLDGG